VPAGLLLLLLALLLLLLLLQVKTMLLPSNMSGSEKREKM
jgi:hypothetical protein